MKVKVTQSYPTLCNPTDYTVHGVLQARILEWVAVPFSRGSPQPRDWTLASQLQADSLPAEPQGSPRILEWVAYLFSRGSSCPRNWTQVSCIAGGFLTTCAMRKPLFPCPVCSPVNLLFWKHPRRVLYTCIEWFLCHTHQFDLFVCSSSIPLFLNFCEAFQHLLHTYYVPDNVWGMWRQIDDKYMRDGRWNDRWIHGRRTSTEFCGSV